MEHEGWVRVRLVRALHVVPGSDGGVAKNIKIRDKGKKIGTPCGHQFILTMGVAAVSGVKWYHNVWDDVHRTQRSLKVNLLEVTIISQYSPLQVALIACMHAYLHTNGFCQLIHCDKQGGSTHQWYLLGVVYGA